MFFAAANGGVRDAVNGIADSHDQIMLAMIAVVAAAVAALVFVIRNSVNIKIAAEQATAANSAVNSVGPDKHTIYAMVERIHDDVADLKKDQEQFDSHGWETLPSDLSTAVGLTTTIRDLQNNHKSVNEKLDTLIAELREHVVWEMSEKWGLHQPKE